MFRRLLLALALLCAPAAAHAAEPVKVVASFSILADMVRQVGGEAVAVRALVGPDADAHVFEPSPADARALAEAQLLVVNGLGYEGWLDRLVAASAYRRTVVVASSGVSLLETMPAEHHAHGAGHKHGAEGHGMSAAAYAKHHAGHHPADPHAWQDLSNARTYVANIAEALVKAAPQHEALFRANAQRYQAELAELDAWVKRELAAIPAPKRRVITGHDAFGYFARAYGVNFLAPVGVSTDAEPSAGGVARLIQQIRKSGVRAVFIENMTDPRLVQQLAKDSGAVVGGALYADALSAPGGPAPSYAEMFRHNVRQLAKAMAANM